MTGRGFLFSRMLLVTCGMVASSQAAAGTASNSSTFDAHVDAPEGFEALDAERESVVDLYFGGERVGEALVSTRPGAVRFLEPARVAAMIPNLARPNVVAAALSGELRGNPGRVCSSLGSSECGRLSPEIAGIIYDEDRFRIDLFVNPHLLKTIAATDEPYLPEPGSGLSLTNSLGFTLSGSSGGSTDYNVQNRTILALHGGRVRSDSSYSSGFGLVVDNLVAEVDRPGFRYSAGMFWAPGIDLVGRRRIIGAGVATQFDTRSDRDTLQSTSLLLFLDQPARVEMVVDGRLVGSRLYEAGNNLLDTSGLPDGAYTIVLRVREAGGQVREERRFFTKNAQIAPVGQPIYFAFAGLLADTRENQLFSASKRLYYQIGTARRLSRAFAIDVAVIGTDRNAIAEAGAFLITPLARVRIAGLASSGGDRGALLQLVSAGNGPLSASLDARRIWSSNGRPLIPLPGYVETFGGGTPAAAQLGNGSYTQASGSINYRIGTAYVGVLGSLRRDAGLRSSYSVGPSVSWSVIQRGGVQLTLNADAQRTRETTAAFVGFRLMTTINGFSTVSRVGHALRNDRAGGDDVSRQVGSLSADWYHDTGDRTQIGIGAGIDRSLDSTIARASGTAYSSLGSIRGDILHDFRAGEGATQYALTLQSGAALAIGGIALGGRDLEESAVIAGVDGASEDSTFDVLVNDSSRGRIRGAGRLPIFLQPYRAYRVRIVPVASGPMNFDSAERKVVLYPGNVQPMRWKAKRLFTIFGKALRVNGTPIAGATVESGQGIGETDANGYFQIDVAGAGQLAFSGPDGVRCGASVPELAPKDGYAALGEVICR